MQFKNTGILVLCVLFGKSIQIPFKIGISVHSSLSNRKPGDLTMTEFKKCLCKCLREGREEETNLIVSLV